jgi:acid phosphatase type 7
MPVVHRPTPGHVPGRRCRARIGARLATTLTVIALACVPQPAAAASITAAGDISSPPGGSRGDALTADLIRRWNPTAVLALGDVQYEAGELANFQQAYDRSWGAFKAKTYPVVGNHEYLGGDGAAGYFDYFGAAAGPRGLGYYSFEVGSWHVVALNSSCSMVPDGGCGYGSAQWSWLKHDLAAHRTRCTLAFFHAPYRASTALHGGAPELAHLWAQLVAGDVDLVLNGHNHIYERLKPMRTPGNVDMTGAPWTIVAGTGGLSTYPVDRVHPSSVYRLRSYGVYRLIMYPDRWIGAFKGVDGNTYDRTGQRCH